MDDSRVEEKSKSILGVLRHESVSPSPYAKTRIVAEILSRRTHHQSHTRTLGFWRLFALGGSVMGILALSAIFWVHNQSQIFKASVHQALVVRVDVQDLKKFDIAQAKILLPDGVEFFIEDFPEISQQRELLLQWKNETSRTHFAFVVRGQNLGLRDLKVKFLNASQTQVAEKSVRIRFEEQS